MEQKTLKQTSEEYIPKKTLNIVDLDRVDLSWPVVEETGVDSEGKEFTFKVMTINSQKFRVPGPVMEEVKKMLDLKPDLQFVKVTKTGSGSGTRYTVKMVK